MNNNDKKYIKKDTELRPAQKEDIPSLLAIIGEVFQEYNFVYNAFDELPDFFDFEQIYLHTDNQLFVITEAERVVACGGLKFDEEKSPNLTRIYVSVHARKRGYGIWMVTHICNLIRDMGFPEANLWTDTRFTKAHALYEKLGFKKTGNRRPLHDVNHSFEIEYRKSFL